MSTVMSSEDVHVDNVSKSDTAVSKLREVLSVLTEQSNVTKAMMLNVRTVIKDLEKQSKELEKYRNKKYRVTSDRKINGTQSGITKPVAISADLAKFIGVEPGVLVARNEVTRKISSYIRENNLSDPQNRQKFILTGTEPGERLSVLLGKPDVEVSYFNLQKYIKHHYVNVGSGASSSEVVQVDQAAEVSSEEAKKTVKKKVVLVKKAKRPEQLVEE